MSITEAEITKCSFYDVNGDEIISFNPERLEDVPVNEHWDNFDFGVVQTVTIELDNCWDEMSQEQVDKLNSELTDSMNLVFTYHVQAKKHRKKRINKKWAKRYGYKEFEMILKDWKPNARPDGRIEFVNKMTYPEYYKMREQLQEAVE